MGAKAPIFVLRGHVAYNAALYKQHGVVKIILQLLQLQTADGHGRNHLWLRGDAGEFRQ